MKKKNWFLKAITLILIIAIVVILILFLLKLLKKDKNIELLSDVLILEVGEIKQVPFSISEDNDELVVFNILDTTIAKVDNQGYVYGLKIGETFVTMGYSDDDNYTKRCKVIVKNEQNGGGDVPKDNGTDDANKTNKDSDNKQNIDNNKNTPQKVKPICKLSVSKDGNITATVTDAIKYGFKKDMSDNIKAQHVKNISNKEVRDYEGWKYYRVSYYVKSKDDVSGSCNIIVIEKCDNSGKCVYENY